jgi:hypothetical protein
MSYGSAEGGYGSSNWQRIEEEADDSKTNFFYSLVRRESDSINMRGG